MRAATGWLSVLLFVLPAVCRGEDPHASCPMSTGCPAAYSYPHSFGRYPQAARCPIKPNKPLPALITSREQLPAAKTIPMIAARPTTSETKTGDRSESGNESAPCAKTAGCPLTAAKTACVSICTDKTDASATLASCQEKSPCERGECIASVCKKCAGEKTACASAKASCEKLACEKTACNKSGCNKSACSKVTSCPKSEAVAVSDSERLPCCKQAAESCKQALASDEPCDSLLGSFATSDCSVTSECPLACDFVSSGECASPGECDDSGECILSGECITSTACASDESCTSCDDETYSVEQLNHLTKAAEHLAAAGMTNEAEGLRELIAQGRQTLIEQKTLELERLQSELASLRGQDEAPQQVVLNVQVVELSLSKMRKLGLTYKSFDSTAGESCSRQTSEALQFGLCDPADIARELQLLEKAKMVRVLAAPNMVTVVGQPAHYEIGGFIPVAVATANGSLGLEQQFCGTKLDVLVRSIRNGKVALAIRPNISELNTGATTDDANSRLPQVQIRSIDTGLEMPLGKTATIGGCVTRRSIEDSENNDEMGDVEAPGSELVQTIFLITPELVEAAPPRTAALIDEATETE